MHYELQFKRNSLAKRIIMRVKASPQGLPIVMITLPSKARKIEGLNLLKQHEAWISKQINLQASKSQIVINRQLSIFGQQKTLELPVALALNKLSWLKVIKQQAEFYLPQRLLILSERFNLPYNLVKIGNQLSRWGSCNRLKSIRLNCKLLFLPIELIDHILLHELCHTVEMNHSAKFWQLLSTVDPLSLSHKKQLKLADIWVPHWFK